MYPFDFKKNTSCIDGEQIINNNWQLVENYDGTVSLYDANLTNISSTIETKPCCEALGYTFDLDEQKCRWGTGTSECNFYTKDPYKIVLNPNIDEGVLFSFEDNEVCTLDISFDYLFKFDCEDVLNAVFGSNGGQTLVELKDQINLLTQQINDKNNQIVFLVNEVQTEIGYDIPYVIQCITTATNEYEVNFYDKLSDKEQVDDEQSTAFDNNLDSGFYTPPAPNAFAINNPNVSTYCLTNDGLLAWETILGTNNYNLWLASNGTDTTLYDCSDVSQLLVQNQTSNNLIRTTCDYTIYDKNISITKINQLNLQISGLQSEIQTLQTTLAQLNTELDALDDGNCPLLSVFEDFNAEFTLEVLNTQTNRLETVYSEQLLNIGEGNLYNYISSTGGETGILISGFSGCEFSASTTNTSAQCLELSDLLFDEIYNNRYLSNGDNLPPKNDAEYNRIREIIDCWYQKACWLQYSTTITGNTINQIRDKSINISIKINNSCSDFSILLDRIKLDKKCTKVENVERFISEPPKFEIEKVIDNKKSWVSKEETEKRFFELKYRNTEYQSNHHKLIINTKEVDLNLSPARAVENDVWCFVEDNNCILEGCNETYTPFSCPVSYTALTSFTACEKIETTGSTSSATEYTASTPNNFTAQNHSLDRGTIFIEDITTLDWPIYWTGTPQNTWVGPYYNVDYLTDSSGKYVNHTGFGKKYSSSGALIWSSPDAFSGEFSEFGNSSSDLFNLKFNPNILWGGTSLDVSGSVFTNLTNTTVSGRLYNGAIWTNSGSTPDDEWIGFSYTFDLDETKVYRIGFAADQKVRIKVNGSYLINSDISPVHPINSVDGVFNATNIYSNSPDSRFKQAYLVAGITLYEGKNIIEAEGFSSGFSSGFVCEVYNASEEHLMNMRYETELSGVTVFSTRSQIGNVYTLGENSGYSCPTGYALDTSIAAPYQCLSIDRIGREEIQDICCCEGFPIVIEELDGEYVELPLTASTTTANVVSDLTTLLTNPDNFQKLDTLKCGQAYLLSTTAATPDDYVITTENDGTIGLYLLSGTTYYNVSNESTSGLCGRIDVGFQKYFNATNQGILKFPTTKWDPNLGRCAYNKAGDDGCLNLDDLLTTELSEIDTVQEFSTVISSEFIDAKNRQTISSYPTLRLFYDRYNNHALEYCDVDSSSYDYFDMDNFGKTVGDYWIELIEQVVPATTIWNSTYTYRNTIFDQQKYKYKSNNIYLCEDPSNKFPFSAISTDNSVSVETFKLGPNQILSGTTITVTEEPITLRTCTGVWAMQNTCNPTFLGTVKVTGKDPVADSVDDVIIAP
jgi:cell division protein FtsB